MRPNANYFFIAALSVAIILAVLIFLPFLAPLVLAGALAVVFYPLHRRVEDSWFRGREKSSLCALVTLVIVAVIIFIPLTFIGLKISFEVREMYQTLTDPASQGSRAVEVIQGYLGTTDLAESLRSVSHWAFTNINSIFSKVSRIVIEAFIMLLALFYFLRDGKELKRQLINISPLGDMNDMMIINKLQQAIRSIFAGSIAVALVQGVLSGIGFALFGVPNPVLWGVVAALAALIPGIGTALVLLPAIGYLFFTGSTGMAIGLLVWGFVAVGLIDNFLGPILVNRGVKIHPFLILLSIFGGPSFFGPIGFVLGPLIVALLFALLEIYRDQKKSGSA